MILYRNVGSWLIEFVLKNYLIKAKGNDVLNKNTAGSFTSNVTVIWKLAFLNTFNSI